MLTKQQCFCFSSKDANNMSKMSLEFLLLPETLNSKKGRSTSIYLLSRAKHHFLTFLCYLEIFDQLLLSLQNLCYTIMTANQLITTIDNFCQQAVLKPIPLTPFCGLNTHSGYRQVFSLNSIFGRHLYQNKYFFQLILPDRSARVE